MPNINISGHGHTVLNEEKNYETSNQKAHMKKNG